MKKIDQKEIMKQQADRNFKNITKIHLDIQNERLNQDIRDRLTNWARIGVNTSELRQWNNLLDLLLNKKSENVKETERKDLLLAGKCPECGRQKYGFSLKNDFEKAMEIVDKHMSSLGWHKYWNDRQEFDVVGCRSAILQALKEEEEKNA